MAEIKVNSQVLRDAATQLTNELGNFSDISGDIEQGLSSLSSTWEGDAFNSFLSQLNALSPSLERYSEVIRDYANFLNTTAEQYETTEAAAQNETEELANNLFK
jgi:WXG100 family type VII secretion target